MRIFFSLVLLLLCTATARAAPMEIIIAYLGQVRDRPPALSNLDTPPADEGLAGALLGIDDNNTTGRFTNQHYTLAPVTLAVADDPTEAVTAFQKAGRNFIIADLIAAKLETALQAPGAEGLLFFNVAAPDIHLREARCRANLLHTLPSRVMLADALMQYLVRKRWTRLFLIEGPRPEDVLYAAALRRAAMKFGAKIVSEKKWTGDHDARRTAQAEMPLFTQDAKDHHVILVADEIGDFGDFILFRSWAPRPVAGTQGLVPTPWHRVIEQWGAAQLQSRFVKKFGRPMTARDYAAWLAVRSVGEAATRTAEADPAALTAFIKSAEFALAAFKGRKLSYRPWNGQLRQPIPLVTARSLVSQSPQEGFLHPLSEMDTLGIDRPESRCALAKGGPK
ncbi:MAG: ABC transporter substrate-binding protein [Magnetospiraceae bacterium]